MWASLLGAEWCKIMGNRRATFSMIGIFPALAILATVVGLLMAGLSSSFRSALQEDPALWTEAAILPWLVPNNPLGRALLLGFAAVLFAGEYQWNTWKSIVPRTRRLPLLLVKFVTVAAFVVLAFTLTSILLTLGLGLVAWVAGAPFGPPLSSAVLCDFAEDYGLQVFYAFLSTMIAAGMVALVAMLTRSILASALVSIVIAIGETLLIVPLYLLAALLRTDGILHLYRVLPGYNLLNFFTWLAGETPEGLEMPSGELIIDGELFSAVVLVIWMIGLISLSAYLFNRQDI